MANGAFDRDLQRRLLEAMREVYPQSMTNFTDEKHTKTDLLRNISYLHEHGLCNAKILFGPNMIQFGSATITAKGIDFLEDDGGLAAILGVVTVKFHAETIRDLLNHKIESSDLSVEEKSKFKKSVQALSDAGLKAVTTDLVHTGLSHVSDLAGWLGGLSHLI